MPRYVYLKAPLGKKKIFFKFRVGFSHFQQVSHFFLIPLGLVAIFFVIWQIFSYKVLVLQKAKEKLVAPISQLAIAETQGLVNPLVAHIFPQTNVLGQGVSEEVDYDLINNWFPAAPVPPVKPSKITHYALSIPKLGIEKATVEIGGTKVKEILIHYPGTAVPGQFGNGVILGHSVLPAFYNPKDYKKIFSLLPTLENGDKIYLFYDGIEYVYEVFDYLEVKPEEIDVLAQRFDQQTISLITCVPPGTYLKRGLVRARLVKF